MRMYEATGMGTLLLTDGKTATHRVFSDDEVVYYTSLEDAVEKVKYFLEHTDERNAIAKRGQEKTIAEYNYEKSSIKLLEFFDKYSS
jgi:spore maturation protein CgeB